MFKFVSTILLSLVLTGFAHAGTWTRAEPAIVKAAYATNYPVEMLAGIASMESGFKARAVSSKKAKGLMQQVPSTFRYLEKKYGKKHGIKNANPNNPLHSAIFGAEYLKEIRADLSTRLKRKATYEEAYLGYYLGPNRAAAVIRAAGWKDAVKFMPSVASSHKKFFYNGKRHKTIREFRRAVYAEYNRHVDEYRDVAQLAMKKHVKKKRQIANVDFTASCLSETPTAQPQPFHTTMALENCIDRTAFGRNVYAINDRRRYI